MIVGITGKSGSGKSEVAGIFAESGFTVIDLDKVSREVSDGEGPCLDEIVCFFGEGILLPDGTLNRRALGEIVFNDEEKLLVLNNITHKYILNRMHDILNSVEGDIVIDAPLLFDAGIDKICDVCVYVTADTAESVKRISVRDGISTETASARLERQKGHVRNMDLCDYVIENLSTLDSLHKRTVDVIDCIRLRAVTAKKG